MLSSILRLLGLCALSAPLAAQTPLTSVQLPGSYTRPTWAGSPPGDARVFVTEQFTGQIHVIKNGAKLPTPFLDLGLLVLGQTGERGLLSMAFHPDYAQNGHFYVFYTRNTDGAIFVERYTVSAGNPDVADINSSAVMLGPLPHSANNHNGGMVAFDASGALLVSIGDNDAPPCYALDGQSLFGKLLRLDVDAGGVAAPGNPFLGDPNFDDRIWAYGLRNPWRFSVDAANGDLYIGDVGEAQREEINWAPGTSTGGENYGWNVMEGTLCTGAIPCAGIPTPACNAPELTLPVVERDHSIGCSISGGVVYRGCAIPDLHGTYFYSDWCASRMWTFEMVGGVATNPQDRTSEIQAGVWGVSGFGEDGCGEILIVGHGSGSIWKIVPAAEPPSAPYCFGDGSGAQCPCSASGAPGGGCLNSGGTGAKLTGSGTPSFSADTLVFDVEGVPGSKPGLILRGNNQVSNQVGDGLLCAAGQSQRSRVQVTNAQGMTTYTDFDLPGGSPGFGSVANGPGTATQFQFWYRDPAGTCSGAGFNFTNAWTVTYVP